MQPSALKSWSGTVFIIIVLIVIFPRPANVATRWEPSSGNWCAFLYFAFYFEFCIWFLEYLVFFHKRLISGCRGTWVGPDGGLLWQLWAAAWARWGCVAFLAFLASMFFSGVFPWGSKGWVELDESWELAPTKWFWWLLDVSMKGTYLLFVIFLHRQNFWRIKFTPKSANFSR